MVRIGKVYHLGCMILAVVVVLMAMSIQATHPSRGSNISAEGNCTTNHLSTTTPRRLQNAIKLIDAKASSTEKSLVATHVIDENPSSRWASERTDSQWIYVELQEGVQSISQVILDWEVAFGRRYRIDVSTDGRSWTTKYEESNGNGGTDIVKLPNGTRGKYVRMFGLRRGTKWGFSLYALKVLAAPGDTNPRTPAPIRTPNPTPLPNPSQGDLSAIPILRAFAKSHITKYPPRHAIDKDPSSRWASRRSDKQWIAVELNGIYDVAQVQIDWWLFGESYRIETSMDRRNWVTQVVINNGNGGKDIINFPRSVRAKYVRVFGLKRGTPFSYSLYNIAVFGTGELVLIPTPRPMRPPTTRPTPNPTIQTPNPTLRIPAGPVPVIVRAFASSKERSYDASNAIDKNRSTRWASNRRDPQWIAVELLQVSSIGCVVLEWEAAYGREYRIETSNDGRNWVSRFRRSNGGGGIEKLSMPSGIFAKYLRLYGIRRGSRFGYSLWELDILRGCNEPPSPPAPPTVPPKSAPVIPTRPPTNSPTPPSANGLPVLDMVGDDGSPKLVFPLGLCQGDCDNDRQCSPGLKCFQRSGTKPVPGCSGTGEPNKDYCYFDTKAPGPPLPTPGPGVTYLPGDLSERALGWKLSRGMAIREVARRGSRVRFANGGQSSAGFHSLPDGAECFPHPDGTNRGFAYVSNSEESSGKGGVGAIYFNGAGDVVGYKRLLSGTWRNCGAAGTPWGSYMTMEEHGRGRGIWQVDPWDRRPPQLTVLGLGSDVYESFAYDYRNPAEPKFFFTNDRERGPLGRFIPSRNTITSDPRKQWDVLHDRNGEHRWLVLKGGGTFEWSTSKSAGEASAKARFQYSEGIEHHDGKLYFTSKRQYELFILDLDRGTYTVTSTKRGNFRGQPDQIRFHFSPPGRRDPLYPLLYFTEDGSRPGIHVRTIFGDWFTVVEKDSGGDETSGIAFSPDDKFMFYSAQHDGRVYKVWRKDGRRFNDPVARINYI